MSMTATVSRLSSFQYWRRNEEATTDDWLKDLSAPPNQRMDVGAAFQTVLEKLAANPGGEVDACEADGFSFNFKCDAAIPQPNPVYGRKDYGSVLVSGRAGIVDGKRIEVFKTTKRFEAERRQDDYQWRLLLDLFDADEFVWNIFVIAPKNPDETRYDVVDYHRLTANHYPGLHDDCVSLINDYHGIMSSIPEEDMVMASTGRAKALPREAEMLTIYGDIVQETEDAILVDCGMDKPVWLAKSQIKYTGARDDLDVEISIPDWLAAEKGVKDGQRKTRATEENAAGCVSQAEGNAACVSDSAKSEQQTPPVEPAPACHFKGDVTEISADSLTLLVTTKRGKEKAFTYSKADMRFEGDDVADLQVGYKGIDFVISWETAVESGLAKFLRLKAPKPAPEAAPQEQQDAAAPADQEAAPSTDEDEALKQEAKPYKSKLRSEKITDYVKLTDTELANYGKDMSEAMTRRTEHKETAAHYSRLSRDAEKAAYKLNDIIQAGHEEREIHCDVIGDFNTGEIVYVESEYPHREIRRQPMTEKDRQLLLPIDPPAQSQPEPEEAAQPAEPESAKAGEEVPRICETCARFNEDQAAPECAECQTDASLPQWLEPEQELETVTLYGEVLEQRENETVFRVHYGDDDNTVAEFTIPNEQFQLPAFADTTSTQDFITLTLAYAVEAGIVAAPEEDAAPARTCETCIHYDSTNLSCEGPWDDECSTDKLNPAYLARWEPLAEPEKACNACAHLDFAADNNACEGCGDDLSNFTPLAAAEPQGQDASAGGVQ